MPPVMILSVHYSHNALMVSLVVMRAATGPWEPDYRRVENFTLGSEAAAGYSDLGDYWDGVKSVILEVLSMPFPSPQIILITGNRAHGEFMDFLNSTVTEYLGEILPVISGNAEVVAAMGAAEFMRRTRKV